MADTSNSVLFDQPGPKGRRTIRIVNWVAALIFVGVLVLILMRLHNPPDGENQLSWELWKPALEREAWTDFYLPGLWMTVKASIVAVVGSVVFGLVFGVGRLLPNVVLRAISSVVVEFCRAVPVLLLMIFFWRWSRSRDCPARPTGQWCWPWCCITAPWSPSWCVPASATCRTASVRRRSHWD